MESTKIFLNEADMPRQWYNIAADMPNPMQPILHPGTGQPVGPDDLAPLFPMGLILQEVSQDRWVDIPEKVLEIYRLWRPSPLIRARRLEQFLDTPAKIYYKYEGVSPAGSHKPNTSVAQAYYSAEEGVKRISTETGAGQWGSALSMACSFFGLECKVFMVKVSYNQKPYRKSMMNTWGATVIPSPSEETQAGRSILEKDPNSPGSLGIAISEAVEEAVSREDTKYSLGSVLNHVLMHQTIVGLEAKKQMEMAGDYPDIVIGCFGGGSNFAGISFPFAMDKIAGKEVTLLAVEPKACPTLTRGEFLYDFGDATMLTPLIPMYTLGHDFVPPGIHAGGLRYHGASPLVSQLYKDEIVEACSYNQTEAFQSALDFSRVEGIIPAPETAHAIKAAMDQALKAKEEGKEKTILFNLSGHGHFDMGAYDDFLENKLTDYEYPAQAVVETIKALEGLPKPQ